MAPPGGLTDDAVNKVAAQYGLAAILIRTSSRSTDERLQHGRNPLHALMTQIAGLRWCCSMTSLPSTVDLWSSSSWC